MRATTGWIVSTETIVFDATILLVTTFILYSYWNYIAWPIVKNDLRVDVFIP